MSEQKGKRLMSRGGGIGDSRVTSTAAPEEFERFDDGLPPKEQWTWGGKTADQVPNSHMLPWESTDQSIAIRIAAQLEREMERGGRIAVVADPADKLNQARIDTFKETGDPGSMAQYDAKKHVADEYRRPGYVQMYAPKVGAQTFTGPGSFQVVRNEDGAPVEWKDQVLLERPVELQARENRRDEELARSVLTGNKQKLAETMRKQARDQEVPLHSIKDGDFGLSADPTVA